MDEAKKACALKAYDAFCAYFKSKDWTYEEVEKTDEKITLYLPMGGEDIPMKIFVVIDVNLQLVRIMSPMPFKFPEDKRVDGAIVTCIATSSIVNGAFDYDISDGSVAFRMTNVIRDSVLGEETINYIIGCTCVTVDEYNDKFLAVSKGMMSIEKFIEEN